LKDVDVRRKDGTIFSLVSKRKKGKSPFEVPGMKTKVITQDIVRAVRESRVG